MVKLDEGDSKFCSAVNKNKRELGGLLEREPYQKTDAKSGGRRLNLRLSDKESVSQNIKLRSSSSAASNSFYRYTSISQPGVCSAPENIKNPISRTIWW